MNTEAGERMLAGLRIVFGATADQIEASREDIAAIEAEAEHRGYLRANDCDHSECIEHEEALLAELEAGVRELADGFGDVSAAAVLDLIRSKRA